METGPEVTGPVNLGNPVELPIAGLAEKIIALTGSKSKLVDGPLPEDDPTQRCPDIGLARKLLSWEPTVALDGGLSRTIEYFRTLRAGDRIDRTCAVIGEMTAEGNWGDALRGRRLVDPASNPHRIHTFNLGSNVNGQINSTCV